MEENQSVLVKVIQRKGAAALVEYETDSLYPCRKVVPVDALILRPGERTGWVNSETLDQGIEYGIPWADLLTDHYIVVEDLATALRNAGVWTVEDYEKNGAAVQSALLETISAVFADVAKAVKKHKHQEK